MSGLLRRGRPPSASLEQRSLEGMSSTSRIKCEVCYRDFPRAKSLRAHMYTHTGEKPHECDYPGCDKAFRQSGQLRSHIFLHTGEKRFRCPIDDCGERFTHSNRHCFVHDPLKKFKVIRDGNEFIDVKENNLSEEQQQWLQSYRNKKYNSQGIKRPAENDSDEVNIPVNSKRTSDDKYKNKKYKSRGTKRPAENDSDEENIPVNNKKTSDDRYDAAGSELSSSTSISCECDEREIIAEIIAQYWKNCWKLFTHSNRHYPVRDPLRDSKVIRDGNEFIDVKEDNLSEEQQQWLQRYRNKKYNSQGTKRPADNASDEENIPVNNSRTSEKFQGGGV